MDWYKWADESPDQQILEELDKIGNEFVNEVKPDDDMMDDWEKLQNDPDFWDFVTFFYSIRFYLNFAFIALPWWIFSGLLEVALIVVNAWLNNGWAEGNFYLMINTVFGFQ